MSALSYTRAVEPYTTLALGVWAWLHHVQRATLVVPLLQLCIVNVIQPLCGRIRGLVDVIML